MRRTLKETRQLNMLKAKVESIDKRLPKSAGERLLTEKFDQQEMKLAIEMVKRMKSIDFGTLNVLKSARDEAVQDVVKVMGGNTGMGLVRRIASFFTGKEENPLVDFLAFAEALHNFFGQMNGFIGSLATGVEGADEKTVQELMTGAGEETDIVAAVKQASPDAKKRVQQLQTMIIKGLRPEGALQAIAKNWVSKYLKNNLKGLAQDIMKTKVGMIKKISESITQQLSNASDVGQAAVTASAVATKETQPSIGTEKAAGTEPTAASAPGVRTQRTATTGEASPAAVTSQIYQKLYRQLEDAAGSESRAKAVLKLLGDEGYLKV